MTDNIQDIENLEDVPIYIFWHIFIDDKGLSRAEHIINRQFDKIKKSGLLDRCNAIYIGYASTIDFPLKHIITHPKVKIIAHKVSGNEGVTTTCLKQFCDNKHTENLILYIHNRGMSHDEDSPSEDWTLMMEYFVVENWRTSIHVLKDKYTCGCEMWCFESTFHYSGNFWWSRSSYIKLLPFPSFHNRHTEAELWVLMLAERGIKKEHFGILHRTSRNRYERGRVQSYIDRYPSQYYQSCKETPDIEIDETKFHGEHCTAGC